MMRTKSYVCATAACLLLACGENSSSNGSGGSGGSKSSSGGNSSSGGTSSSGGSSSPGGTSSSGGKSSAGGSSSAGASSSSGGTSSASSTSSDGGSTGKTGGSGTAGKGGSGTGGSSGGSTASGGKTGGATGGSTASGGTTGSSTSGTIPPSCQDKGAAAKGAGLSDCGDGESCCTSLKLPGGKFYRTYKNDGSGAKDTADEATVSDFQLDKYLVTVARFRKFVEAWDQGSGYTPEAGSGKHSHLNGGKGLLDSAAPSAGTFEQGWLDTYSNKMDLTNDTLDCQSNLSTWKSTAGDTDKLPMNCINWFEAYAFCIWDGGFLPSEAEYVYATAGGSEQRKFPWGSTAPGKDNKYAIWGYYFPDGSGESDGTIRNIAPVGTAKAGAGKWGHLDLVGNMIEWNLDYYSDKYPNPCTDCAVLYEGSGRSPRDGYFGSTDEALLQSSSRNNGFYPANRFQSFGFRCARTP